MAKELDNQRPTTNASKAAQHQTNSSDTPELVEKIPSIENNKPQQATKAALVSSSQSADVSLPVNSNHGSLQGTKSLTTKYVDILCPAVRSMGYSASANKIVGYGAFSRVYRARSAKVLDRDIAVKIVRVDDPSISQAWKDHSMRRELRILKKVKHPNVIHVHDVIKTRSRIFIFMDLAMTSVSLHLQETEESASEQTARIWFGGICNAIAYLHQIEIAHRDLKNDNILIDSNGIAKITDFGFACFTYDKQKKIELLSETSCGTKAYVAPEVFNPPYNAKQADVWSIGVCLFECLTMTLPFKDDLPTHIYIRRQMQKGFTVPKKLKKPLSETVFDLLKKMMEPNIEKRIRSEAVLIHPWIRMQKP